MQQDGRGGKLADNALHPMPTCHPMPTKLVRFTWMVACEGQEQALELVGLGSRSVLATSVHFAPPINIRKIQVYFRQSQMGRNKWGRK